MGLRLEGQTTGHVTLQAPATAADNTLTLPNGNGSNGDTLITNGSGVLSFSSFIVSDLVDVFACALLIQSEKYFIVKYNLYSV